MKNGDSYKAGENIGQTLKQFLSADTRQENLSGKFL